MITSFNHSKKVSVMAMRYVHNPLSLMSEVLAAVLRCENLKIRATVGQVEKQIINIRVSRTILKTTLRQLNDWGLLSCEGFKYRKNVTACEYRLSRLYGGDMLIKSLIAYNADLLPYFPEIAKEYAHA